VSTHPNVMLQLVLTVDDGSRKTERGLLSEFSGIGAYEDCIAVAGDHYSVTVMESDYEDGYQISADEGQIVMHMYVTYGYGETISAEKLLRKIEALREWAESAKNSHKFSYEIRVGANYW